MEFISSTVKSLNGFMWDFLLLFLLVGTGIWFTIRLRGVQLRYIGKALKTTFGNFDLKGEAAGADAMSDVASKLLKEFEAIEANKKNK